MQAIKTLFLTLILLGIGSSFGEPQPYDEIRLPDGSVRPHYRKVMDIYDGISEKDREALGEKSKTLVNGDWEFDLIPRLLTHSEAEEYRQAIDQRARAIVAFLKDHHSGEKRYLDKVIPESAINRIMQRSVDYQLQGQIKPHQIAFTYAPDGMRIADPASPKGYRWNFLEDNAGDVGGEGDLAHARKVVMDLVPEYGKAIQPVQQTSEYFRSLVDRHRGRAKEGVIVLYSMPPHSWSLTSRFEDEMKRNGVEVISHESDKKLKVDGNGAYLDNNGKREKVGFVMLGGEIWDLDWSHPYSKEKSLVDFAADYLENRTDLPEKLKQNLQAEVSKPRGQRDLDKLRSLLKSAPGPDLYGEEEAKRVPGLMQGILDDRVVSNEYPGSQFIDDKEFYTYVDKLVEFYLKEKPIATGIRVERDPDVVAKNQNQFVIKNVGSFGGYGVRVGPNISKEEFEEGIAEMRKMPDEMLGFDYVVPSRFNGKIVDFRGFAIVDPKGVHVGKLFFGRSSDPVISKGKVNLSIGGSESAVVEVPDCDRTLNNLAKK